MADTMRAVVFDGPGRFSVRDMPRPRIQAPDDVLLRVDACGICGTDLHIVEDPPGYPAVAGTIMGHEFSATVLDAGERVLGLRPGDRVVMEPDLFCHQCAYCARGLDNLCLNIVETGIMRDGGLAEYAVAPARALHPVPAALPSDRAALIEPLACCLAAADKARILAGDSVVVLGAGPIGLLYLQVYKAAGAGQLIVVEPRPLRAERARALGASLVLNPFEGDLAEGVHAATGIGADVVIDAVGSAFAAGLPLLRRGGSMVLFGLNAQVREPIQQLQITTGELKIFGSLNATHHFRQAIGFMAGGGVRAGEMITHRVPLEHFATAVDLLRAGEAIKVLVLPHG